MRLPQAGIWLAVMIMLILFTAISGCDIPGISNTKTVKTDIDAGVQVIDRTNNMPVPSVPVFFMSCNPNNKDNKDLLYSSVTDSDGWAMFSVNNNFNENDVVYLGASTDKSFIESDCTNRDFNGSGKIGAWKPFGYDTVKNSEGREDAYISISIRVDKETGKLID